MKDGPINTKSIEDLLKEFGITQYKFTDDRIVHFAYHDDLCWLQYDEKPTIRAGISYSLDDCYDLDIAKRTARECNNVCINAISVVEDDRTFVQGCMTFANGIYAISEALPHMLQYLEEARLYFMQMYQQNVALQLMALQNKASILAN